MTLTVAVGFVGLGTGIFVPANSCRLLSHAAGNHHGLASGILATARNIGMMLGVAIAAATLSSSYLAGDKIASTLLGVRVGLAVAFVAAIATMLASYIPDTKKLHSDSVQGDRQSKPVLQE
jgi:MFS family permease